MGIWGEVKNLDGDRMTATIKPIFSSTTDEISFDYCIICAGCNFGPFKPMGESLWFPTIHEEARKVSDWPHIDERFIEGRRRHVLQEFHKLHDLNKKEASILVVGAGFIGVEWATEIEHFFPDITLTIIDFLPRCLGPLPDSAAAYCSEYMSATGIKEFYNCKYDPKSDAFWKGIELPEKADVEYICIGVKASNYFMPKSVLSDTELRDASDPEDFLPWRGTGLARVRELGAHPQEQGLEAHVVAVGRRHVRHELGAARRVLRHGRK